MSKSSPRKTQRSGAVKSARTRHSRSYHLLCDMKNQLNIFAKSAEEMQLPIWHRTPSRRMTQSAIRHSIQQSLPEQGRWPRLTMMFPCPVWLNSTPLEKLHERSLSLFRGGILGVIIGWHEALRLWIALIWILSLVHLLVAMTSLTTTTAGESCRGLFWQALRQWSRGERG